MSCGCIDLFKQFYSNHSICHRRILISNIEKYIDHSRKYCTHSCNTCFLRSCICPVRKRASAGRGRSRWLCLGNHHIKPCISNMHVRCCDRYRFESWFYLDPAWKNRHLLYSCHLSVSRNFYFSIKRTF